MTLGTAAGPAEQARRPARVYRGRGALGKDPAEEKKLRRSGICLEEYAQHRVRRRPRETRDREQGRRALGGFASVVVHQ